MSSQPLLAAEIPKVKMINNSLRVRAVLVTLALMLVVYFLLAFTTAYEKDKMLDRIMEMAIETEKRILHVRRLDHELAVKIARLDNLLY